MEKQTIMELLADIAIATDAICAEDKNDELQEHTDAICHHVNCIARKIDELGSLHLCMKVTGRKYKSE